MASIIIRRLSDESKERLRKRAERSGCSVDRARSQVAGLRHAVAAGALILKVKRGRRMEQIRVLEGESFDVERSGLVLRHPFELHPSAAAPRLRNLVAIMQPRKRRESKR